MMRLPLTLLCCCLLASLTAEDPPVASPLSFRLEYAEGHLSWQDGEPSQLSGGVQVWYESVLLHSDRMSWVQSTPTGSKRPLIDRLDLDAGPAGPTPDRILLDSAASQLAAIGFRGRFTPTKLHLERLPVDAKDPQRLRWRMEMADPQYFAGLLQTDRGWIPHAGWAARIEAVIAAEWANDRVANLRFVQVDLFGIPNADPAKRVRARLDRLLKPIERPEQLEHLKESDAEYGIKSLSVSMFFDDQGRFRGIHPGSNTIMYGVPPADTPVGLTSRVEAGQ